MRSGTVSTNAFLPKIHNFAIDMNWLPATVIPRRQWPAIHYKEKRAIKLEEHQCIIAAEVNPERKTLYQLCWHLGASQGDIANLKGEDTLRRSANRLQKNPDGTTMVSFKPYHFEEDLDNSGLGHVVTQIRDLKIKSRQNGIVTIDSENKVGMAQASQIKIGVYPNLLTGYFAFDPTGRTLKFQGDLPFIDYWTDVLKERLGFFSILFPNHPVGVQDTWTEGVSVNSSGGATLDNPLTVMYTFTRELDLMTNGNPITTFVTTSGDHSQNISGYFEQNEQRTGLNISQFDHSAYGAYHFDQKRGVLLDANTTDTGEVFINMLGQGNTATSHLNIETVFQMTLITEPIEPNQKQP